MKASCPRCNYELRSEVRRVGAFRFVVYLDGKQPVDRCPRCNLRLDGNALKPEDISAASG